MRYVCHYCWGQGKVWTRVLTAGREHDVLVPCLFCAARGLPSEVHLQEETHKPPLARQVVVEVIPEKRLK